MSSVDVFRPPDDSIIDPHLFAEALHLPLQDLAGLARVHPTAVHETPSNPRLQGFLREASKALLATYEIANNRDRTIDWFCNSPIAEFNYLTPMKLVAAGKTDAVLNYLTSIAAGPSG